MKHLALISITKNDQIGIAMPVMGEGWKLVTPGTHSDGSALIELEGPAADMYFMVFDHGPDETVGSVSEWRLKQVISEDSKSKCSSKRIVSERADSVIAKSFCYSRFFTDPNIETITVIKTSTGVIELYGHFSSLKGTFKEYENDFKTMASGFSPL